NASGEERQGRAKRRWVDHSRLGLVLRALRIRGCSASGEAHAQLGVGEDGEVVARGGPARVEGAATPPPRWVELGPTAPCFTRGTRWLYRCGRCRCGRRASGGRGDGARRRDQTRNCHQRTRRGLADGPSRGHLDATDGDAGDDATATRVLLVGEKPAAVTVK